MGKFNLAEHIAKGVVPELGTTGGREQIEYLDIDLLDEDPRNFYDLSKIDELAANIEMFGVLQPIRVRPAEVQGRYVVESGHRRRAAVRMLVAEGQEKFRSVPCIVTHVNMSLALQELLIICNNRDNRVMTPAAISKEAERVEELLIELKEKEGVKFPGRMRDLVADICQVSKSKLSRLKVIRENLEESWRVGYEKGKLAESAAYALAQMPQARQRVIYDGLAKQGQYPNAVSEHCVKSYGGALAAVDKIDCQTYAHGPCANRDEMRKRVMSQSPYSYSYCRQCCADCPELAKCKYACPMLEERVKALKEDAKARRQQEQDAKAAREQPDVEQVKALWRRFGEARAAAGKTMKEYFESAGISVDKPFIKAREKLERLEGTFTPRTELPYGYGSSLYEVRKFVKLADLLGVSLDYLLCRTDAPEGPAPAQPEGQLALNGWMPGGTLPSTDCDVVADFDLGTGKTVREPCQFFSGGFHFASTRALIDLPVVRWMALPPVEDAPKLVPELGTGTVA